MSIFSTPISENKARITYMLFTVTGFHFRIDDRSGRIFQKYNMRRIYSFLLL